jgi:hypothetical protein
MEAKGSFTGLSILEHSDGEETAHNVDAAHPLVIGLSGLVGNTSTLLF